MCLGLNNATANGFFFAAPDVAVVDDSSARNMKLPPFALPASSSAPPSDGSPFGVRSSSLSDYSSTHNPFGLGSGSSFAPSFCAKSGPFSGSTPSLVVGSGSSFASPSLFGPAATTAPSFGSESHCNNGVSSSVTPSFGKSDSMHICFFVC